MYTVSSPHTRMRSPGTEDSNLGRTGGLFSQYDRDPSSKPIFCLQNIKCKINELLLFGVFFLGGGGSVCSDSSFSMRCYEMRNTIILNIGKSYEGYYC